MERVKGETIGRRIVKNPPPGLDLQLAEELAKIHAIPRERLPVPRAGRPVARFYDELDSVGEPHPAIELGLHWVKERLPRDREPVVVARRLADRQHRRRRERDRRRARLGVRASRRSGRGSRLAARAGLALRRRRPAGSAGSATLEPYLERYAELTGREVSLEELLVWEVFGNVKWATGCLTQSRRHFNGQERSVELAVLGRLAAEMEYELLDLIDTCSMTARHDRPRRNSRRPSASSCRRRSSDPRRPPAEVPDARRDQRARDRRARAWATTPATRGGLGARPPDPRRRRPRERGRAPEGAGGGEAPRLESPLSRRSTSDG